MGPQAAKSGEPLDDKRTQGGHATVAAVASGEGVAAHTPHTRLTSPPLLVSSEVAPPRGMTAAASPLPEQSLTSGVGAEGEQGAGTVFVAALEVEAQLLRRENDLLRNQISDLRQGTATPSHCRLASDSKLVQAATSAKSEPQGSAEEGGSDDAEGTVAELRTAVAGAGTVEAINSSVEAPAASLSGSSSSMPRPRCLAPPRSLTPRCVAMAARSAARAPAAIESQRGLSQPTGSAHVAAVTGDSAPCGGGCCHCCRSCYGFKCCAHPRRSSSYHSCPGNAAVVAARLRPTPAVARSPAAMRSPAVVPLRARRSGTGRAGSRSRLR